MLVLLVLIALIVLVVVVLLFDEDAVLHHLECKVFPGKRTFMLRNVRISVWDGAPETAKPDTSIILMHGICGSVNSFHHAIPSLQAKYSIIYAIDLPGFGHSLPPEDKSTLDLVLLELSRRETFVTLCGHSFGAFLACRFAMENPCFIYQLVLVNPVGLFPILGEYGAYWGVLFKSGMLHVRLGSKLGLVIGALCLIRRFPAALYWFLLAKHTTYTGNKQLCQYIDIERFQVFWNAPLYNHLHHLSGTYIHLVHGEDDPIIPGHQGSLLRRLHPAITYEQIPQGTHDIPSKFTIPPIDALPVYHLTSAHLGYLKSSFCVPRTRKAIEQLEQTLLSENN
jgi:pimeloyl-ACP methyl ester carboxylesterase